MIHAVLNFVRETLSYARGAPDSLYRDGYIDALEVVEEHIVDEVLDDKSDWYELASQEDSREE